MCMCLTMSSIKVTHGSSHKYAVQGKRSKDALSRDEQDLYELCSLSGVDMSPAVFRIVLDLLRMNVSPVAIVQMLKSMVHRSAKSSTPLTSDSTSCFQTQSSCASEHSRNNISSRMSAGVLRVKENSSKTALKTRSKPTGRNSHKM